MSERPEEYIAEYYEANSQDRDRAALWFYQRLAQKFSPGKRMLDFGAGVGHLTRRMSASMDRVYALEINEFARSQISLNAPKSEQLNNISELGHETVDFIAGLHVLEHISDDELCNLGVHFNRVLTPHGRCLFVMPNPVGTAAKLRGSDWMGFRDPTHINLRSPEQWQEFFKTEWKMHTKYVFADGYYDGLYHPLPFGLFQDIFAYMKTLFQFIVAKPMLEPNDGEATIFILEKM